jgi:hypothetical protein
MLAADAAELLQLQTLGHRLPVLGGRIVPLFAIAALQGNDLSGHKTAPSSKASSSIHLRTENQKLITGFYPQLVLPKPNRY